MAEWGYYQLGGRRVELENEPSEPEGCMDLRDEILPRITRLLEADHLSLLVGNGLTTGAGNLLNVPPVDMSTRPILASHDSDIDARAKAVAAVAGRGTPNIEDQFRATLELLGGLRVQQSDDLASVEHAYGDAIEAFAKSVLDTERGIEAALMSENRESIHARETLVAFMMAFERKSTRERLHLFTTNYDRLVEYLCDLVGLWKLDRFIGGLNPRFRASRLDVDIHYNPPGIRGEPRYLEGVIRLTKLHGSIDWIFRSSSLSRTAMPFGCDEAFFDLVGNPADALIVYPNPVKDMETSEYPYSELFRDFSNAVVRPQSVLVTYGYGFGDGHVNRVIADMLSVHSTHLVLISHTGVEERIERFVNGLPRSSQITLLVGKHFGDLTNLTRWYLPRPLRDFVEAPPNSEPREGSNKAEVVGTEAKAE